jgi:pyruvate/2-oxoacid:ferredoxin oxidoreductase beta subunit
VSAPERVDPVELSPGHLGCKGCGGALAMRYALEALGERTVLVIPASCMAVVDGPAPFHAFRVPMLHCAFGATAAVAMGVRHGFAQQGVDDIVVAGFAGDGGTFDIGLQGISGAAERNEDILFICYDNEAYMNTGAQRSAATPEHAVTTTTPSARPKRGRKKRIAEILAAHGVPYLATASIGFPDDALAKLGRARVTKGFRFLHFLCPCPTGWGTPSDQTVRLARQAVQCRVFPLFEVEDGERWRVTLEAPRLPVTEYLRSQRRFAHLSDQEISAIQDETDRSWRELQARAKQSGRAVRDGGPRGARKGRTRASAAQGASSGARKPSSRGSSTPTGTGSCPRRSPRGPGG